MWYRPHHAEARRALGHRTSLGFFVHRAEYDKFYEEAQRLHPEHTEHENAAWAAHCARTHPQAKTANEHHLMAAIVGLILLLFAASYVHAEPTPEITSVPSYWATLRMTPPNLMPQIYGGPMTARMQIRNAGVWTDVDASTGLPITCLSGCGGAASFTDNSAFTNGTTAVNNISGVFNDSITALTTGNAGAIRSTSDRMLFVNVGKLGGTALSGANVVDSGNTAFRVNCVVGCGSSSFADNGAFTAGTTPVGITAGWFANSPTACTTGSACAPSMTSDRKLFVQSFQGTSPWVVSLTSTTITGSVAVTGTFFQATQPVSGTVTTSPPANATTNVTQWATVALGSPSNYGTSPGAVTVPGVNAFITNIPHVIADSGSTTAVTGNVTAVQATGSNLHVVVDTAPTTAVTQSTSPWVVSGTVTTTPPGNASTNLTQVNSVALGSPSNYGTSPGAVSVPGVNAFVTNIPHVIVDTAPTTAVTDNLTQYATQNVVTNGVNGLIPTGGYQTINTSDAAWTSATSVNTAVTIVSNVTGYNSLLITLIDGTTLTVGAVTFEESNDNSTWIPLQGAEIDNLTTIGPTYTLLASTNVSFEFPILAPYFRVRLSTAITGSATVTVSHVAQASSHIGIAASAATQPVSGTITANQGGAPWSQNLTQVAGTALGATAVTNFGTAPAAAAVPGVNANIYSAGAAITAAAPLASQLSQGGAVISNTNPLFTSLTDGTTKVAVIAGTTALKTDLSSVAGTAASTAASGVLKVGIVGNTAATLDSTIGAATAPTDALATSTVFQSTVPALTAGQAVAVQSDQTGSTFVNIEGRKQTYRAVTSAFAPIASATAPSFSLTGSGTKTVRITRVFFSCSASTGGIADVVLMRLSALSGGTSAAVTIAKNDSGNATATAAPLSWSAAATTATSAGNMHASRYELVTPAVTVNPLMVEWLFGGGAQDFVLRGTSEFMALRFSAIATTPACEVGTEWTEE